MLSGRAENENRVWCRLMIAGVLLGAAVGLAVSVFPDWVFYETALFYAENGCAVRGVNLLNVIMNRQCSGYFVSYLCIRVLIPFVLLLAGILSRGLVLLRIQTAAELLALAFQSALVFASGGMEQQLLNLSFCLLPESCILLAIIPAFCKKKSGFGSAKQYILTVIRGALLLCCGAVVEIYLFQCFV
ncbi:MAG: hypothetical protein PUG60_07720 [Lachnospiraceae bacterium]|nr:hypothetical protein [Lachnospiraceae bacterium]